MAELWSERLIDDQALLMRVRYRNALGHWDSLIDGDTGKPLDLKITEDHLAEQANPQAFLENVHILMNRLLRCVSVMERQIYHDHQQ